MQSVAEEDAPLDGPYPSGVFCPRCASTLVWQAEHLVCTASGADFSEVASRRLREVAEDPPDERPKPSQVQMGGTWYCPADGAITQESDGLIACTRCERVLPTGLIYQLIEFHEKH